MSWGSWWEGARKRERVSGRWPTVGIGMSENGIAIIRYKITHINMCERGRMWTGCVGPDINVVSTSNSQGKKPRGGMFILVLNMLLTVFGLWNTLAKRILPCVGRAQWPASRRVSISRRRQNFQIVFFFCEILQLFWCLNSNVTNRNGM